MTSRSLPQPILKTWPASSAAERGRASGLKPIVVDAADALANVGLVHAGDFTGRPDQRKAYLSIRGCGPVTWTYFGMLLGEPGVKADTWIVRFVHDALGRSVTSTEAEALVSEAAAELRVSNSQLDHAIWQAARSSSRKAC